MGGESDGPTADPGLALLSCLLSSWEVGGAAKFGLWLFYWKEVCRSTVAQQEAGCRGRQPHLNVGMALNSLGWLLWRRVQALKENMRKSALVPQNKNILTTSDPQTASLNQKFLTFFSI